MRRFIWLLLVLTASVWLGLQIVKDPGLAYFSYLQWSVAMPLWLALLAIFILIILCAVVWRFFNGVEVSLYRLKNWLRLRNKHKSYSKTNRGLVELIEHNWQNAEYYLLEGLKQADTPLINYLALAKAADALKDYDKRDQYLRKAYDCAPQAEVVIGLTQAQFQIQQSNYEQALATLTHLRTLAPHHPLVLKLLERVYIHLHDFSSMLKLLPSLYKARVIPARDQYAHFERHVYSELLLQLGKRNGNAATLSKIWQELPRKYRKDPEVIYAYATGMKADPERSAELAELINLVLKKQWHADLVAIYSQLPGADPKKQLVTAEKWLNNYPNQATLLLALGRICMRCQLWGKARSYYEDSIEAGPQAETYLEYGKLLEQLGDSNGAIRCYRDGLALNLV